MYADRVIKTVSKQMGINLTQDQFRDIKTIVANYEGGVDLNNIVPVVRESITQVVSGNNLMRPSSYYKMLKNENPVKENNTKCPSCARYMTDAKLTNETEVNYCIGCKIILPKHQE